MSKSDFEIFVIQMLLLAELITIFWLSPELTYTIILLLKTKQINK